MERCLFLDDHHIAHIRGLTRRVHQGTRHPANPVMRRDHPWEAARVQIYGRSILRNAAGKFRMYYIAMPGPAPHPWIKVNGRDLPGHTTLPAYAESDDGVHWVKPMLGQRSFGDLGDTNLLDFNRGMSFESGALFDPGDPDPGRRYKLFYWDQAAMLLPPGTLEYENWGYDCVCRVRDGQGQVIAELPYNDWGIDVAFSPDGIRWSRHPGPVFRCYSDTGQSVLWDPRLGRYVAFGRFNLTRLQDGGTFNVGRSVARVTSADFLNWSEPELVLAADHLDPPGFQINSMPVDLYEGLYVGMMETFVAGKSGNHSGPLYLACSRDGRSWTRVGERASFLDPGPAEAWDSGGAVRVGSGLIVVDDRVHLYYGSGRRGLEGVGLATWRRDGFVSLRAEAEGDLLTRPLVVRGRRLHLNLDAPDGQAVVQVCDHQGAPLPNHPPSLPVGGDQTAAAVAWDGANLDGLLGRMVSLRMQLRRADLYSFWFA